jgi:hypothetical protein
MPTHFVRGTVKQAGLPVARTVRVYLASDGSLQGSVVSSATDGTWQVDLDSADDVFAMVVPAAGYDPDCSGPWTPLPLG